MSGALSVPNAVAPFDVTADPRSSRVACSIKLDAPEEGKPATRVNWLLRQLKEAPSDLLVSATPLRARADGPSFALAKVLEGPRVLVIDPKVDIKYFTLALNHSAGTKRGQGQSSFVNSVLGVVEAFYASTVQHLRPWVAPAPKV